MNRDIQKLASETITALNNELEVLKLAQKITFNLFKEGNVASENLEYTLEDLANKTIDELKVIEKAASMHGTNYTFGRVSDGKIDSSMSPENQFISSLLED